MPIADLHCDLLSYLSVDKHRTIYHSDSRCSLPQIRQGGVKYQTLAVFTETEKFSVQKGMTQVGIFKQLPIIFQNDFIHYNYNDNPNEKIALLLAFESASSFCDEAEPLIQGLKRLDFVIHNVAKPLYISLTWNSENRFGGGALTTVGLKKDGEHLLDFLHGKGIAVDFSHASDKLARDIFDYIDRKNLLIPIMASHSNSRKIKDVPRNLPDEIAREVIKRKGVIGLNVYRPFIGDKLNFLSKHLERWFELGGEDQICFGADFFYEEDVSSSKGKSDLYFPEYSNASCYGAILEQFRRELDLSVQKLEKISITNFLNFIHRIQV